MIKFLTLTANADDGKRKAFMKLQGQQVTLSEIEKYQVVTLNEMCNTVNNEQYSFSEDFIVWVDVTDEPEPEPNPVPVVTILFGNFTFSKDNVLIHSIEASCNVPANQAKVFGDILVNTYPAYLIPDMFNGEIIWDAVGQGDGTIFKSQVQEIADAYAEKRSDVSEVLNRLCETGEVDLSPVEHRYAKIELPTDLPTGTCIQYDTLTTLFSIYDPETNNTVIDTGELNHEYE